jgi:RsiW-degrading membrane proteinase PrsW (M82 family)
MFFGASAEFLLFAMGTSIYVKATRAKRHPGTYALWSLLAFLLVAYLGAAFDPPPPNAHAIAVSALALWVLIPWAAWADRHREIRPSSSEAHRSP